MKLWRYTALVFAMGLLRCGGDGGGGDSDDNGSPTGPSGAEEDELMIVTTALGDRLEISKRLLEDSKLL